MARDVILATITLLKADATLAALVGTRVFGGEVPQGQAEDMRRPLVVIRKTSGGSGMGGYIEAGRGNFDSACFAKTIFQADEVWRALHNALKQAERQVNNGTLLHWFNQTASEQSGRDSDTNWPMVEASWEYLASEVEAT